VPALEQLAGLRVVASPSAIDDAIWTGDDVIVIRIAPDEALGIGASAVAVDDPDAIVEPETGFVGVELTTSQLGAAVAHVDWPLSTEPGTLAQGKVAGVPAKVLTGDRALLVTQAAYADELADRLGWSG
jgi:hypothetical protein